MGYWLNSYRKTWQKVCVMVCVHPIKHIKEHNKYLGYLIRSQCPSLVSYFSSFYSHLISVQWTCEIWLELILLDEIVSSFCLNIFIWHNLRLTSVYIDSKKLMIASQFHWYTFWFWVNFILFFALSLRWTFIKRESSYERVSFHWYLISSSNIMS